jgi:hypothetical protein
LQYPLAASVRVTCALLAPALCSYAPSYDQLDDGAASAALGFPELRQQLLQQVRNAMHSTLRSYLCNQCNYLCMVWQPLQHQQSAVDDYHMLLQHRSHCTSAAKCSAGLPNALS